MRFKEINILKENLTFLKGCLGIRWGFPSILIVFRSVCNIASSFRKTRYSELLPVLNQKRRKI